MRKLLLISSFLIIWAWQVQGSVGPRDRLGDSVLVARLRSLDSEIFLLNSEEVRNEINNWIDESRMSSAKVLAAAEEYFPNIEKKLRINQMPTELKLSAVAMSGMDPFAINRDGGGGLWGLQFVTGIRYGLIINDFIDQRRDPEIATDVAIAYFQDLNKLYKDWTLTLLAYLAGPASVNAAIWRASDKKDLRQVYELLSEPAKELYRKFVAAVYLDRYKEYHGFFSRPTVLKPKEGGIKFHVDFALDIREFCKFSGWDEYDFRSMNPIFRSNLIPGSMGFTVNISSMYREKFQSYSEFAKGLAEYIDPSNSGPSPLDATAGSSGQMIVPVSSYNEARGYHVVKPGETWYSIARIEGVTIEDLQRWNSINTSNLQPGQLLVVSGASKPLTSNNAVSAQKYELYKVKSGDTLWKLSQRFRISEHIIKSDNRLNGNLIYVGQNLKIRKSP
jgi:membrane-bound lytic murein transglycosylase D